jgi:hypothetical protein
MKNKFFPTVVLIAGCMLISISASMVYSQTVQSNPVSLKIAKYTCPMHPEIVKDHPGNCPKCGMKLVDNMDKSSTKINQNNDSTMLKNSQGNKNQHNDSIMLKDSQVKMRQDTSAMDKLPLNDSITKNNPVTLK